MNEKNNILTLFRKNIISEDEVEEQLEDIKKEEKHLMNLIEGLESKLNVYVHENDLINEMSAKLKYYRERLDTLSFEDRYNVVKLLVKEIITETIIENGSKVSHFNIIYNLVKLDTHTDNHTIDKFDLVLDKKSLPIICAENNGSKLRNLRLKNKLTIKELAKKINISETTLRHIELDKIKSPYYYWKLICDYFNVDHIAYLQLYTLKEISIQDKLIKIRALLGARTWQNVGEYLGYSESFINDIYTRYTPDAKLIDLINKAIEELS